MRLGMVIDLKRCIGCYGCQLSCKAENGTPPGVFFARVLKQVSGKYPTVQNTFLPVLCNHCDDPPCVEVCPTGAAFVWEEDGIVDVDHDKCVGCRTCMLACPYSQRFFNDETRPYFGEGGATPFETARASHHQTGVILKCNLCRDRVRDGGKPACVENCPTVARIFGDFDDPNSEVSHLIKERGGFPLRPEKGTKPRVYYLPA
ncbi:MAG: 4Fe-4S dicluster domain-containing protein [Rhodospirillaceae bacterium]|jgi:molybdopterin-containing oxidoreductase family iron-sulfur binding subunit|nr:4Fe-4S dicluster domain-containing protein [Rhodospirillaceae bacterium]MBT4116109.1 4Fe-4S dicluster domain-containing protein [Rhodospirillaceae bacterium]MBT4674713.1 4Fe-4S dicluster domain-containing protein [Rhodospirillaceae bacterium]MBT4720082.1 4Fe-4S dicluster domain-containing protein [Rhodospirillaceae bacterium]MBT4751542.1 4Fe-4S dicluster domain-containing protein [Rhodospirillaceae bacterium]